MNFDILTLFPELFHSFLKESLIQRAIEQQQIEVALYNFRQHGLGKHHQVDDTPYGGGAGMVLRVEPLHAALKAREAFYQEQGKAVHRILITPQGQPFTQKTAQRLSQMDTALVLVCGRYEGFDERVRHFVDEEISGGDFICLGGEVIAMMMMEAISRLLPGMLGNQESLEEESFAQDRLEYPQYTRPLEFEGLAVPEILRSGHHGRIAEWRAEQALLKTQQRRPDLLS